MVVLKRLPEFVDGPTAAYTKKDNISKAGAKVLKHNGRPFRPTSCASGPYVTKFPM